MSEPDEQTEPAQPGQRIRINTANIRDLGRVRDIGPLLARRIVRHRELRGFLHSVDDLARVRGIDQAHAARLAGRIDWSEGEPRPSPRRDAASAVMYLVVGGVLAAVGVHTAIRHIPSFPTAPAWNYSWTQDSVASIWLALAIAAWVTAASELTRSGDRKWVWWQARFAVLIIAVAGGISLGLGNLVYYQRFAPHRWSDLLRHPFAVLGLVLGVVAGGYVLRRTLAFRREEQWIRIARQLRRHPAGVMAALSAAAIVLAWVLFPFAGAVSLPAALDFTVRASEPMTLVQITVYSDAPERYVIDTNISTLAPSLSEDGVSADVAITLPYRAAATHCVQPRCIFSNAPNGELVELFLNHLKPFDGRRRRRSRGPGRPSCRSRQDA